MGPLLSVENLSFRYPDGTQVLEDLSIRIAPGEHTFIEGPSGSGKSTLLGLLTGIHLPSSGSIHVLGADLTKMGSAARDRFRGRHMGYIFQMFNLIPYLSVLENVTLPARLNPERSKGDPVGLLKAMGMGDFLNRPVEKLSVGQQQRVAAARAFMGGPEIIIADEPTSALDMRARDAFLDTLTSMAEKHGSTILFVSHDPTLAGHFDRKVSLPSRGAEC